MVQDHERLPEAAIGERVQSVLAGDPSALDQWYRAEHPEVYRLCVGFLADTAEAEDAAQDALLHLRDRLSSWAPGRTHHPHQSWRAWRDTVVLNLCRDRLRRRSARERAHQRAAHEGRGLAPGVLPDPSDEAQRSEVRALLEEVLRELPPREREAFVLRDLEQRSSAETAELMGIEAGSVRSLLTLARRRLRQLLSARSPGLGEGGQHD